MNVTKERITEIRKAADEISAEARTLRAKANKLVDICDSLTDHTTPDEAYR